MSTIAIITARGGSKRIPGKNKRMFHGKPIIAYSIEAAKKANIDEVFVSTDDDEIRDIGWEYGAKYIEREPEFARDEVGTKEVMGRCVQQLGCSDSDIVCCIYPTAPMIDPSDINTSIWMLIYRPAFFVVAVGTEPLADSGQFYVALAAHWNNTVLPIYGIRTAYLPVESNRVCDINSESDWRRAEQMYAALQEKLCKA